MSFKAKDLQYDDTQPAFLRRLRGQLAGDGSGRHEQPIPRNKRLEKGDDEDDAPTYVLEDTNQSLSKAEYEAMVTGKDSEKSEETTKDKDGLAKTTTAKTQPKDNIAEVGRATKKRKVAKVIAEEKDGASQAQGPQEPEKKAVKKAKKKATAVKLSFGDE